MNPEIEKLREVLDEFAGVIAGISGGLRKHETEIEKADREYKEKVKKNIELQDKITIGLNKFLGGVDKLTHGKGSVTSMSGVIDTATDLSAKGLSRMGGVATAVGAAVKGLGAAFNYLLKEMEKAYGVYEQLAETGVARTFEDLQRAGAKTQLTFDDVNKVLGKNSKTLALFGSNVMEGSEKFQRLAQQSVSIRDTFQRIGITASDFNEYQIAYMERLQITGQLEGKSNAELLQGTTDYILQLDALSKITGKNRKEIQSEMENRSRETRYQAAIYKMDEKTRREFDAFLTILPKDMAEGLKEIIASGGAVTGEAAKTAVVQYGDVVLQIGRLMSRGLLPAVDATNMMIDANKRAVKSGQAELAAFTADNNRFTKNLYEKQLMANRPYISSIEELIALSNKTRETQGGLNSDMADAKTNMYKVSQQLELLVTSFASVAYGARQLSRALKSAAGIANKYAGVGENGEDIGSPAFTKISKWVSGFFGKSNVSDTLAATPGILDSSKYKNEHAAGAASAASAASGQSGTAPPLVTIGSKSGKTAQVATQYADSFQKLVDNLEAGGYQIRSLGGYNNRDIAGQPGVKSIHSYGAALDINPDTNPVGTTLITDMPPDISKMAAQLGLGWGGNWKTKKDAMHFSAAASEGGKMLQAAGGLIADGPKTGYPVIHHGREITSKIDPNSILEHIATTPINSTSQNQENARKIAEETHAMSRKYDEMIKVLSDIRNIQKTLMMRTYA